MEPKTRKTIANYVGVCILGLVAALLVTVCIKSCGKGLYFEDTDAGPPVPLPYDPINPTVGAKASASASQ